MTSEVDPLARRTTYAYDRVDNRTRRTDARGNVITSAYDAVNRLTSDTYPTGRSSTFTFDRVSNRTVMADVTGIYTTAYSARNEVTSVVNPDNKQVQYAYVTSNETVPLRSSRVS